MNQSEKVLCPDCGKTLLGASYLEGGTQASKLQTDGYGHQFVWCDSCRERVYLAPDGQAVIQHTLLPHRHHHHAARH